MEYHVLRDGWIKIDAGDFNIGGKRKASGRLLIGLNQLLIRIAHKTVLIDTGLGEKWTPEQLDLLDYERPRTLMISLADAGVGADEVDIVVLSHLHYDHSGGGTLKLADGKLAPTFTNSLYYIQRKELDFAGNPGPDRVSDYRSEDWLPLSDSGQLQVVDGEVEILDGLSLYPAPGHSPGHQVVLARDGDSAIFFPGDLFSTREHANLEITMSYDLDRIVLIENRRKWLKAAAEGEWDCVFCHAIREAVGRVGG